MLVSVSCQLHSNFYYWNLWAQKWFSTQFFLLSPLSFLVGFSCFRLFLFPFLLCSNCCLLGHAGWWPWLPERVGMDGGDPGQTRANCSSVIGNCFSIFVCHLSRRQLRWNFFLFFFLQHVRRVTNQMQIYFVGSFEWRRMPLRFVKKNTQKKLSIFFGVYVALMGPYIFT